MTIIGIRTDWNETFGFGHLYRCITLANKLESTGHEVIFFTISSLHPILKGRNIVKIPPSETYQIGLFKQYRIDLMVNDILDTDFKYMRNLSSNYIKTLNLDDLGEGASLASRNIVSLRRTCNLRHNTLSGLKYLILREEFAKHRARTANRNIDRTVSKIAVVTTGTIFTSKLAKVLNKISHQQRHIEIRIFSAESHSQLHDERLENLILVRNADANLLVDGMVSSDIGIAGCGITAYEMACTGLPVITVCKSDFERSENRIAEFGFAHPIFADSLDEVRLSRAIDELREQRTRRRMSEKGYNAVDGLGLYRVSKVIEELLFEG